MAPFLNKNLSFAACIIILAIAFIVSVGLMLYSQNFVVGYPYFYPRQEKLTTLLFVGDIMLDRGVEWQINRAGNGDFKFPFAKVTDEFTKADILFGNLESQISDKGYNAGSIYSFRADPKAMEGLVYAGFDVLSLANNHAFDYTSTALKDSMTRLKESKIDYVGAGFNAKEAYSPLIKNINGLKIAFLAFADFQIKNWGAGENSAGIALLNEENLKQSVVSAKMQADLVVISLHFGDEYKTEPNERQKYFSHLAIDEGADLIVGHHPHVAEPIEQYKNGWIAYSLGNFVFDQSFSQETMQGKMLKIIIKGKTINKVIPIDVEINQNFQPEIENG